MLSTWCKKVFPSLCHVDKNVVSFCGRVGSRPSISRIFLNVDDHKAWTIVSVFLQVGRCMLPECSAHSVSVLELFRRCVAGHVSSIWQDAETVQAHKMYCVVVLFFCHISVFIAMCEDVTHSGVMLSCSVLVPFSVSVFGHLAMNIPYVQTIWMRRFWCCSFWSGQCVQFLIETLHLQLRRCVVVCRMHCKKAPVVKVCSNNLCCCT